jgi:hypothetical protein
VIGADCAHLLGALAAWSDGDERVVDQLRGVARHVVLGSVPNVVLAAAADELAA